jgi:AraC-like DNA-binding protein
MAATLESTASRRLGRSCRAQDRIRFGTPLDGVERAAVSLHVTAFEPHRHDTYAVGITTHGVQTFRYRGSTRVCLPGQIHLLHPDEIHDGAPANADVGFSYRIAYVSPEVVRHAARTACLPFVADPVHDRRGPARDLGLALDRFLADVDEPFDTLATTELILVVAESLAGLAGHTVPRPSAIDLPAVKRVHDYLDERCNGSTDAAVLEGVAGMDRFKLIRHFKAAYATTPHRYQMLRRLDAARDAIARGKPLANVATEGGFADQSHLARQFKLAFGMPPGRWRALTHPSVIETAS